ncbi:hypothetical protein TNCV_305311 [Trichonephila clavipes]|nr:hypothetical protein TNCV_305311 [Trichonephila clavipes]
MLSLWRLHAPLVPEPAFYIYWGELNFLVTGISHQTIPACSNRCSKSNEAKPKRFSQEWPRATTSAHDRYLSLCLRRNRTATPAEFRSSLTASSQRLYQGQPCVNGFTNVVFIIILSLLRRFPAPKTVQKTEEIDWRSTSMETG